MRKAEYLSLLVDKLQGFDAELQKEILEDYREHFAEGETCGKTEEELIDELGDIEDMIAELRIAVGGVKSGVMEEDKSVAHVSAGENAVSALAPKNPASCKWETTNGVPNVRVLSKRLDETNPDWIREMSIVCEGECTFLEVDGKVADITMDASLDEQIYITFRNDSKNMPYGFGFGSGGKGAFWAGILESEEQSKTHGRGKDCKLSLHVRVPKGLHKVTVKSISGQVNMENLDVRELCTEGASGDMVLVRSKVEALHSTTASGDIKMRDAAILASGTCSTGSGDIECKAVQGLKFNFGTGSGDIICQNVQGVNFNFGTGSGDIECQEIQGMKMVLGTGSGDIKCLKVQGDNFNFATGSGDIECQKIQGKKMVLGTGSGDIACEGVQGSAVEILTGGGNMRAVVEGAKSVGFGTGSGDGELYLKNVSGIAGEFEVGSGEVEFTWGSTQMNYSGCGGKSNQLNLGDASCKLRVSTNSGDIKVKVE